MAAFLYVAGPNMGLFAHSSSNWVWSFGERHEEKGWYFSLSFITCGHYREWKKVSHLSI